MYPSFFAFGLISLATGCVKYYLTIKMVETHNSSLAASASHLLTSTSKFATSSIKVFLPTFFIFISLLELHVYLEDRVTRMKFVKNSSPELDVSWNTVTV